MRPHNALHRNDLAIMTLQISRSIPAILFGQKLQYICPIPLEDCLELLQTRPEQEKGLFLIRYQKVAIMYINRDEYMFKYSRLSTSGRSAHYISIYGTLIRENGGSTSVSIDTTEPYSILWIAPILLVAVLVIGYFKTMGCPSILAFVFVIVTVFGLVGLQDTKMRLVNIVTHTLPAQ